MEHFLQKEECLVYSLIPFLPIICILRLVKNAIKTADTLKQALKEKGYTFYIDSPTNQIFLVLEDERLKELEQKVAISFWEKADDNHTIIRLATSWATKEEEIKALIEIL